MTKKGIGILLGITLLITVGACARKAPTWQEQYDLGIRYLSEGNYEEAIIAFTAAIEIDPKIALAYVGRGQAYVLSSETEENLVAAQADFEMAIELDDILPDAYLGLADVFTRMNEYNKAVNTLNMGLERTGQNQVIADKIAQIKRPIEDIRFLRIEERDIEYAEISGMSSDGSIQWTYNTPKFERAELTRVEEIGLKNDMYYFNESGTIIALDPDNGNVIWKNDEFGGASLCFAFAEDGDLFVAGFYGPDFCWIDRDGKTIKRIEIIDDRYYWPGKIHVINDHVEITMNGTPDGYSEYILTVPLDTPIDGSSQWRQTYLTYIQGDNFYGMALSDRSFEFKLIYVDGDDIPELWINSGTLAGGSQLCTIDGESVNDIFISEYGNLQYIEREGLFYTAGGHMDVYWDSIYQLQGGQFVELAHGDFGAEDDTNILYDKDGEPIYQYSWNGVEMAKQEYKNQLASAFDASSARNILDEPTYDYYQLQQHLLG